MQTRQFIARRIALLLVFALLYQVGFPTVALALTTGPSTPEVSGFTPVQATDMVDLFTGDFSYNIPLLDVGGYPLNISYHAGMTMEEEASWVGLGWSLTPGALTRDMRGMPDDFRGDTIRRTFHIRPDVTTGMSLGAGAEIAGWPALKRISASRGVYYNTYRGWGFTSGINPVFGIAKTNKTSMTLSLGLRHDSQQGLDVNPSLSMGLQVSGDSLGAKFSLGADFNSRRGLRDLSLDASYGLSRPKRNYYGFSIPMGGITFSSSTYVPTPSLPITNRSFSFHATVGLNFLVGHPNVTINGYQSKQFLAYSTSRRAAYGYLNSQYASDNDIMDFNREKQGMPFHKKMVALPMPFGTYDLFNATGQGLSGQFRAVRNDVGVFHDPYHLNSNSSENIGVEIGLSPNIADFGADIHPVYTQSRSRAWRKNNELLPHTPQDAADGRSLYEPVFFKNSGEMTRSDPDFYTQSGRSLPARVDLLGTGLTTVAKPNLKMFSNQQYQYNQSYINGQKLRRTAREKRNEVFSYLTSEEARAVGLNNQIISYAMDTTRMFGDECNGTVITHPANGSKRKHHISEVTITRPDGSRYVYGIPAYNEYQSEVTFSVEPTENEFDETSGLFTYTANDDSTKNSKGRDQFFDRTELPPYAYAFLLTGVLSPDYQDREGDGITEDDNGSAIRFNYHRRTGNFRWRTPMVQAHDQGKYVARYQKGFNSDRRDDKASYIYGEKEIWYVHSIESKTMLAQFYFSPRQDALGVVDKYGKINFDTTQCQLDSIALYSKADLKKGGGIASDPIKVVHFEYTYTLCPGTPNSAADNKGKLTLDNIYFTYGKGGKGRLNAYRFHYFEGPPGNPFGYDANNVDRWGMYNIRPADYPESADFPYTIQEICESTPNIYDFAKAWNLSRIELPSGGQIDVEYEPDDYAYVQNTRAGQMLFISGFGRGPDPVPTSNLYEGIDPLQFNNDIVFVDLARLCLPENTVPDEAHFRARFMDGINKIYFKCLVDLDHHENWDYVSGYMEWDKSRPLICPAANQFTQNMEQVGIPIRLVDRSGSGKANPVTKAALQLMREHLPSLAYPGSEPGDNFGKALLLSIVSQVSDIAQLFEGFDRSSMNKLFAQRIDVNSKSFIRLCNPTFKKFGGGHRVKSITVTDNWAQMTGQNNASYGQTYSYEIQDSIKVNNGYEPITMSAGVASYEPVIGGDENLMRQPLEYTINQLLAPNNSYFTEKPFGESLFPAPVVGYSQVTVRGINQQPGMKTGWTTYKYYTAKEFPTITDYTPPEQKEPYLRKLFNFFKIRVYNSLTMSQGFMVEVNDMHGKMKQEADYSENGSLVTSTTYHYQVENDQAKEKRLKNLVYGISRTGVIDGAPQQLGVDVDIWQDARQEDTETLAPGATVNSEGFVLGIWPIIIPFVIGMLQKEETHFQSHVITKFVKRYGILDKVTHIRDGSRVTTENLYYDNETGAVLMTKTQNEFSDPVYNFSYPAHWAYSGMGQACENIGAYFSSIQVVNGVPKLTNGTTLPGYEFMFTEGDDIAFRPHFLGLKLPWNPEKLNAYQVSTLPGGQLLIYDKDGNPFNSNSIVDLRIVRSGRRNMAGTPVGAFTSKNYPAPGASIQDFTALNGPAQVVDASAYTFANLWTMNCKCPGAPGASGIINPYRFGILGNWRPFQTYVNYRQRDDYMASSTGQTDIRTDGLTDQFQRFWSLNPADNTWKPNIQYGWTLKNQSTRYDNQGNQTEERDALNIYSAAQFGYGQSLATAVAHNSRQTQMYFDGFEDQQFNYATCVRDCSPFTLFPLAGVVEGVAHTGLTSCGVASSLSSNDIPILIGEQDQSILHQTQTHDQYIKGPGACLPELNLLPGNYLVSAWVKVGDNCSRFSPPSLDVELSGHPIGSFSVDQSTMVIDGWRQITGKITIPPDTPLGSTLKIILNSNNPGGPVVYFDDFRIHPWLGNMRSFVYNKYSMRLMATLDENNYATFYEYNPEGKLIRTKRETERGIMTLQENRSSLKPNNP